MSEPDIETMVREHGFADRDVLTTQLAWRLAQTAYNSGLTNGVAAERRRVLQVLRAHEQPALAEIVETGCPNVAELRNGAA